MSDDKPLTPYINCLEGHPIGLRLGWLGRAFVLGVLATMASTSLVAYRLNAVEEADEKIEQASKDADEKIQRNMKKLDGNMRVLDESQRIGASKDAQMVKQLNALLKKMEVTERIEAPKVEPSKLEALE